MVVCFGFVTNILKLCKIITIKQNKKKKEMNIFMSTKSKSVSSPILTNNKVKKKIYH